MSTHLYLIQERSGAYSVTIIRHGKPRRYKRVTPASLTRCKCIVRKTLNHATN